MRLSGLIIVREWVIVSPWLFNLYMDAGMKEEKMGLGRKGVKFQEEGRHCLPSCMRMTWFFVWKVGGRSKGSGRTFF